jgi:hypothetical protein
MGATLFALSRKRKKRNPEKEKPRSKDKKDTAEKKARSWRHRVNRLD